MSKRREGHPIDQWNQSRGSEGEKFFENRQRRGANEDQSLRPDPHAKGPPDPERRRAKLDK